MAGSSFQFTPESQRRFSGLIDEMQRTTGADLQKVIRNAGRDFTKAAIKATPIGKTTSGKLARNAGFAKAGWFGALIDLGLTPILPYHNWGGQKAIGMSETKIKLTGASPMVEISNQIPFIEEVEGAVLQVALGFTSDMMERNLTRMSRRMAGRWAR